MGKIDSGNNLDSWKRHFDVNFFALVSALKHTLPVLKKNLAVHESTGGENIKGRIVFISSGAAAKGTSGWG